MNNVHCYRHSVSRASGEMADALASGASVLRDVGVQVPLRPLGAVLRTQDAKVTNSKEVVTFVFVGECDPDRSK